MGEAEQKETELKENYWKVMISRGANVDRFYINEASGSKSPWTTIDNMIQRYQQHQERSFSYKTKIVKAGSLKSDDIVIV